MRGRRRATAVALALVCGLLAPGAVAAQDPGFPAPPVGLLPVPDPLPSGPPGSVIDSAPFPVATYAFAVDGHQLLYRSTDRFGGSIAVSGALLVPTGVPAPAGGRPVVAVPHGTVGISDGCAPSVSVQSDGSIVYDDVSALLAGGAIVVATDYAGLGTPGVHPYLDGISAGRAVLDSIRAARAFGGTGPAAVSGMSQGGHATLYAGSEHAAGYAPDVDLRGIAPVAAPTLLSAIYAARDALPSARAYLGIGLTGIVAARPDLDRTQLLTPEGEAAYEDFAARDSDPDRCAYSAFDGGDIEDFVAADPLTLPAWRDALVANEPGSDPIDVPVLMVASEGDGTVARFLTETICAGLTDLGTDLRVWMYDDEGHVEVSDESAPDRATWLLGVLAGAPPAREVDWIGEAPEVFDSCEPAVVPPGIDPDVDTPIPPVSGPAPPAVPVGAVARFTG
ncbi:hypothetical protein HC251_17830 [Iamia sp. SCSIO 61187]|uniref:lipase family protein n=1 Tax=Iamia sp. SCSIO 61187 TaxID=2722752 RepID=UPI001C625D9F|nr:lipase family protein [Iamia sp. SCSIO 61187]QYG94116.1 hypothetical protein HC251_17830 [Iamia sp. SCSIO 61187]